MAILLKDEILKFSTSAIHLLGNNFDEKYLESCSYDLRVGSIFKGKEVYNQAYLQDKKMNIIEVKPSEIVTILTLEEVNLPKNICATVFAINRMSSKGFLILNPGHIDPGFKGPVSICGINLGRETILMQIGKTTIFTIIFDQLTKDAEPYASNKEYKCRSDRDENFSIERARKLSSNIFDLIKLHDYREHLDNVIEEVLYGTKNRENLKKVIDETLYQNEENKEKLLKALIWKGFVTFWKYLGLVALIVGIITGGIKLAEYFQSNNKIKAVENNLKNKSDSVQLLQQQNDSLLNVINTLKK